MKLNNVCTVLVDTEGFKAGEYVVINEFYSLTHVKVHGYEGSKGFGCIHKDLLGPVTVYEADTKELTISKFKSNLPDPWADRDYHRFCFKTFEEAKDLLMYFMESDLKKSKLELYQSIKNLKKVRNIKKI